MGWVGTIPVPAGYADYADAIEAAAIGTLQLAYYTMSGGPGSVNTIEKEFPQTDDEPREYPISRLNAIYVKASLYDTNRELALTRNLFYRLRVRVVTGDGTTRDNRKDNERLRNEAATALIQQIDHNVQTWIPTGNVVEVLDGISGQAPEIDAEDDSLCVSEFEIRLRLEHEESGH